MVARKDVEAYLKTFLNIDQFKDYAPNGLQIEGKDHIQRLVTGVSANLALIEAAIAHQADAILVHHGYFWKNEPAPLVGIKYQRVKALLDYDISLLAYHLPLDAHAELGNNAQLAKKLGITIEGTMNREGVGCYGYFPKALSTAEVSARLTEVLGRQPLHIAGGLQRVRSIAWCTGAAQNYLPQAMALGVDAYLSGEISEQTVHTAKEGNIHYFAAGHHATERYGVQALGEHLANVFGIEHHFIDIDNPV
ncbi:MAG: Nif3-like dinuclear metal center hexameric protein [bacterium]